MTFDKPEYDGGEPLSLTVTVRNVGPTVANQVRFAADPGEVYLTSGFDDLASRPTLAPGESKTFKLGGTPEFGNTSATVFLRTYVEGETDKTPNDNMARAETKIVVKAGGVKGVLYVDSNGNGVADAGEGVDDQQLALAGGPEYLKTSTTWNGGTFAFVNVPVGTYQVRYLKFSMPGSVQMTVKPGQFIVVRDNETTTVAIEAVPAISSSLMVVGGTFDKAKYAKGEPISVTVTLRNTGTAPITNLVSVCDPEDDPATLDGTAVGWGDMRPDGPGITIPAGETRSFTVTDTVPDVAYPTGKVYFGCVFGNDGRNVVLGGGDGNPGLTIGADVAGTRGSVSGRVLLSNGDPVLAQTKIVAFGQATNRIVGRTTVSGSNWKIENLPQGKVELLVVGSWKLADGSVRRAVDVVAEQDVTVDLVVEPGPEVKDPSVFAPDLKVSLAFDKAIYDISDSVLMTIKVENIGTGAEPAHGTWYRYSENNPEHPTFKGPQFQQLEDFLRAPIDLWPGESKQITVAGRLDERGDLLGNVRYAVSASAKDETNFYNNQGEAAATFTWGVGSAVVTLYGDRNMNGVMDSGEELANRMVSIGGGKPYTGSRASTDAHGQVRFTNLPAGVYFVHYVEGEESGWVPPYPLGSEQTTAVNPGDEGIALARVIRPLSEKLKVTMRFDQPSYQPGAELGVSMSFENNTGRPLLVKAFCAPSEGPVLTNDRPEWGQLGLNGSGLWLAAGEKFGFHLTTAMPEEAPDHGYVSINCAFGPQHAAGVPRASATAKVLGGTHTFRGLVVDKYYNPVPRVKLVLLDPDTKKPVVSTRTDALGAWVFPDLPVGLYVTVVVGPWRVLNPSNANVRGNDNPLYVMVEPGPYVADPTSVPGGPGGGLDGGENTQALASTGVSVLGLGLFGLLLVMAGAALRRRPVRD